MPEEPTYRVLGHVVTDTEIRLMDDGRIIALTNTVTTRPVRPEGDGSNFGALQYEIGGVEFETPDDDAL